LAIAVIAIFATIGFLASILTSEDSRNSTSAAIAITEKLDQSLLDVRPEQQLIGESRADMLASVASNYKSFVSDHPQDQRLAYKYAQAEFKLGTYLRDIGNTLEARVALHRALDEFVRLKGSSEESGRIIFDLFRCNSCLAHIVEGLQDRDAAKKHRDAAIMHIKALYLDDPDDPDFADCYAAQLIWNAASEEATADFEWLEKQYGLAKKISISLKDNPNAEVRHWRHRTDAAWSLGSINTKIGRNEEGLKHFEQSVAFANEMVLHAPNDWGYRCDRIVALHQLCKGYHAIQQFGEAADHLQDAAADIAWLRETRPDSIRIAEFQRQQDSLWAMTLLKIGQRGRFD
jgi:tetratricopeptide (TPR) repeat protein